MAGSLLRSFVRKARALLGLQLMLSVLAIALAGWTLSVTTELLRERDRLRERVIQLEANMGANGMVVPAAPNVVASPAGASTPYPDAIEAEAQAPRQVRRDFRAVIADVFAPPPPMRIVVLHVRSEADVPEARRIGAELQRAAGVRVVIDVMAQRDPRSSGYTYFDGRQSAAAAALVTRFHDLARQRAVAAWSAQLRGTALPAQGEYSADRLDLSLPPLPPPPPPEVPAQAPAATGPPP